MAQKDYSRYLIKEPLAFNTFPPYKPRLLFDSKNHFPEMNFGIRYTYITVPIEMEKPHAHDFDQFFCFMGDPEDMRVFDGEVELYLGEESTKNVITHTTVAFIPKGMVHCPIIWKRVGKPMMFINIVLTPQYTRTTRQAEFINFLETRAKKITMEEASRIIGAAIPQPSYLPEGCQVQEIYAQDNAIRLFISDTALEKRLGKVGDAAGARNKYSFSCKMELSVEWHTGGVEGGSEKPGEEVIIGKGKGILTDQETHLELSWLLPPRSTKKRRGQYEIILSAGKGMPYDELLRIAQFVKIKEK